MGGRIAAQVASYANFPRPLCGLIFYGFPLHAAGRKGSERAAIIDACTVPMLFLQGERDKLADITLMRELARSRGRTLYEIPQGDHSLAVPKRTGKSEQDIHSEVAAVVASWIERHL